jgi:hypothetical protein
MRVRCKFLLPVVGLVLFMGVTYDAGSWHDACHRYYWWSYIPLDSEPLNQSDSACKHGIENCQFFGPESIFRTGGSLSRGLILSAAPAFFLGFVVVKAFASYGVGEIPTFMVSMPLLIVGWFYLVGTIIDIVVTSMSRPRYHVTMSD